MAIELADVGSGYYHPPRYQSRRERPWGFVPGALHLIKRRIAVKLDLIYLIPLSLIAVMQAIIILGAVGMIK